VSRRRGRVYHAYHSTIPTFSCSCASFLPSRAPVGVRTHLGRRPAHTSDAYTTTSGGSPERPRHRALSTPCNDGSTATDAPHPARPSPDADLGPAAGWTCASPIASGGVVDGGSLSGSAPRRRGLGLVGDASCVQAFPLHPKPTARVASQRFGHRLRLTRPTDTVRRADVDGSRQAIVPVTWPVRRRPRERGADERAAGDVDWRRAGRGGRASWCVDVGGAPSACRPGRRMGGV